MADSPKEHPLRFYRGWFYAATVYNTVWGVAVILAPDYICGLLHIPPVRPAPFFMCLGMVIGVFAYGYYLLARDPLRYCGIVWIGLAGKIFGPLGFVFFAARGELPWSFGWTVLTNDVLWWPVFISFALRYARKPVGDG